MPRIFDNINLKLEKALKETLEKSYRADFCVGFFNLRGWNIISDYIDNFEGGEGKNCRLLIGMQQTARELLNQLYSLDNDNEFIDQAQKKKMHQKLLDSFREQLVIGIPDNKQEKALKTLLRQLKSEKLIVKFAFKNLHAKLYLGYRHDSRDPIMPYLGSSNLTMAGLSNQGELNVDVFDPDGSAKKLADWFENIWNDDLWCKDITQDLIDIIENSWCREELISPYHIYLKMAYHIAQEARDGLTDFCIPKVFEEELFDYQKKACLMAAESVEKRKGVLIGDVVGLGKTITACAVAKIFEYRDDTSCLIICPANLQNMWNQYIHKYDLRAKVMSSAKVQSDLPNEKRYKLVIIDESHNFRNESGIRYSVIKEYLHQNESKVILLTATPYNKKFKDISAQLKLFITDEEELPVRPERYLIEQSEVCFVNDSQASPRSILAFEKSDYAEDWQELLRYYMVRRTRSFIKDNYAITDSTDGRKYLEFSDGKRSYFPERIAKSVKFHVDSKNKNDQYAMLYSKKVVDTINDLNIPRYGLAQELLPKETLAKMDISPDDKKIMSNLSRAGKEIIGFCRTNLFKRLESCGHSFIVSLKRHILRNNIFLYAIENELDLPIGSQDFEFIEDDNNITDKDQELFWDNNEEEITLEDISEHLYNRAKEAYEIYNTKYVNRFNWISSKYFKPTLKQYLKDDNKELENILAKVGEWNSEFDEKLKTLLELINKTHKNDKILIFTQYADTANYLYQKIKDYGIEDIDCATGGNSDPTALANRFSPKSNQYIFKGDKETRILIATDVLSEGQNLQDSHIIVNFDLPWAIIKLIQRAGRVDRIGQESKEILCYNFVPTEGVEKILDLRQRLVNRLNENSKVVGTDSKFFEDENNVKLRDLYNEKSEVLEDDDSTDIDLSSYAYQIWKNAVEKDKNLEKIIPNLPDIVHSTKKSKDNNGVIVYTQTSYGNDILTFVDKNGKVLPYSQFALLRMAECVEKEEPLQKSDNYFDLVKLGVESIIHNEKVIGGQLGRKTCTRNRVYQRLKDFEKSNKGTLFDDQNLKRTIDEIFKYPLTVKAKDKLKRLLRTSANDYELLEVANELRLDNELCITTEEVIELPPRVICSMGLNEG